MAGFRCRGGRDEGTSDYTGRHACPQCGSGNVEFALNIEETSDQIQTAGGRR